MARISTESTIAQTAFGQVEYDLRGDGPVILHFHGSTTGHNGWFVLEHLVDAGYCLLSPDRPGYLGTSLKDNETPEAQADLAAALLDSLHIDHVSVVGISGGGLPAIQFALRHPHRTRSLVLLSALTQRTPLSSKQLSNPILQLFLLPRFQNVAYFLVHQLTKCIPQLALRGYMGAVTTYDIETGTRYIRHILYDAHQRQFADALVPASPRLRGLANDLRVQHNLEQLPLSHLRVSTLIIHSQYDGDVPYENATNAYSQIPDSELMTVDQFGHIIWLGDPQVTRDIQTKIEAFLSKHIDQ